MASALSCRVASLCSIRTSLPVPRRRRRTKLFQFHSCLCTRSKISSSAHSFSWDDALRVSLAEYSQDDSSNLSGFFDRIKLCNRGSVAIIKTILGFVSCLILDIVSRPANSVSVFLQELQSEFLPLVVEAEIVGYIHNGFANHLRDFPDVFIFPQDGSHGSRVGDHVSLCPSLRTPDDRTRAVASVVDCLAEALIPGIRNELYPVKSSFNSPILFSLERAAAPYFGIKAYGVHMNGYVERNGEELLWIGKRSREKSTFPGMLDHLAAGGLPHDIPCGENIIKECEEEAGIPRTISSGTIPVGAVSYMDIDGYRFKRDVLLCYDLKLPDDFTPSNQDGEVESFKLIPVPQVAKIICRTNFFKPNCSLVIIDFLFRHGYIKPEFDGYLDLLWSLKSGDCS